RTISRFWNLVLTSALNADVADIGLKYARKVFVDAFLNDRDGFVVEVPTVPLGQLYGEVRDRLSASGVKILEDSAARRVAPKQVVLRDGHVIEADNIVLAVPFERVLGLLPEEISADPFFARLAKLEHSPITSVHLWYDRDVLTIPHAVLVDGL